MATINDLYLDDNGFISCKENQTSKEWDNLLTELFKDWKKLQSELKQAKAEAWDEGYKSGYSDGVTFDIEFTNEDKATNPYKPDFNQNSMLERFGELEDEFKVE